MTHHTTTPEIKRHQEKQQTYRTNYRPHHKTENKPKEGKYHHPPDPPPHTEQQENPINSFRCKGKTTAEKDNH